MHLIKAAVVLSYYWTRGRGAQASHGQYTGAAEEVGARARGPAGVAHKQIDYARAEADTASHRMSDWRASSAHWFTERLDPLAFACQGHAHASQIIKKKKFHPTRKMPPISYVSSTLSLLLFTPFICTSSVFNFLIEAKN
jgi:hypothetical protein